MNGIIGRTINNYVYLDRNLVDSPYFQLTNEDNRGVFVPASSISAKGVTDWLLCRTLQPGPSAEHPGVSSWG